MTELVHLPAQDATYTVYIYTKSVSWGWAVCHLCNCPVALFGSHLLKCFHSNNPCYICKYEEPQLPLCFVFCCPLLRLDFRRPLWVSLFLLSATHKELFPLSFLPPFPFPGILLAWFGFLVNLYSPLKTQLKCYLLRVPSLLGDTKSFLFCAAMRAWPYLCHCSCDKDPNPQPAPGGPVQWSPLSYISSHFPAMTYPDQNILFVLI